MDLHGEALKQILSNPFVSPSYRASLLRRLSPSSQLQSVSSGEHTIQQPKRPGVVMVGAEPNRGVVGAAEVAAPIHPLYSLRTYTDPLAEMPMMTTGLYDGFAADLFSDHLHALAEEEEQERLLIVREAIRSAETDGRGALWVRLVASSIAVLQSVEEPAPRSAITTQESSLRSSLWSRMISEGAPRIKRWVAGAIGDLVEDHWRASLGEWMAEATMRAEIASRLVLVELWWSECISNTESSLRAQFDGGLDVIRVLQRDSRIRVIDSTLRASALASEHNGQMQLIAGSPSPHRPLHPFEQRDLLSEREELRQAAPMAASPIRNMLWYYSEGREEALVNGRSGSEQRRVTIEDMTAMEEVHKARRRRQAMLDLSAQHGLHRQYERLWAASAADRRRVQWEEDDEFEALVRQHNDEWTTLRRFLLVAGDDRRRRSASASPFDPWERPTHSKPGMGSPRAMDLVMGMFAELSLRNRSQSQDL